MAFESQADAQPAEQWKAWEDANKDALTRSTTALAAIRRLDNPNIAALSVALRTLRSVVRSGAAS